MDVEIDRLWKHVVALASEPRPAESPQLAAARKYTSSSLEQSGWTVTPHAFHASSTLDEPLAGINLIATHPAHPLGNRPRFCLGAHLDSCPGTPGADDNASAVAALLEIARCLPDEWPDEPALDLELVLFDLEENGMLGGAEHARRTCEQKVDLKGMVSLEMIGYCDRHPGSQALPPALEGMYSTVGDFIAIIGNQDSERLIQAFRHGMQIVENLRVESLAVPSNGEYLVASRLSDHSPFWDAGFPALMITDTSFMRNPHYHFPTDTPDTLDMAFLHQVTRGCLEAVRHIVESGL